jgi:hypothetical protein
MHIHPDALFVLAASTALLFCGVFGVLLCEARGVRGFSTQGGERCWYFRGSLANQSRSAMTSKSRSFASARTVAAWA